MLIKIKLIEHDEDDIVSGTFHLETYDKEFVDELKKYVCPFRLANYLTESENKEYTSFYKELDHSKYNLIIDLSEETERIIDKKVNAGELFSIIPDAYIESTPHLDRYGNQMYGSIF